MPGSIFVSYSRKDSTAVEDLYKRLTEAGYPLWLDQKVLVPGQDWELEIRRAIRESSAVLICLSSSWIEQPGYVQKELKLALDTLQTMPEGRVHTIPVKLDDCDTPASLERLHWVDSRTWNGFESLKKALDLALDRGGSRPNEKLTEDLDAFKEWTEDAIARGAFIHLDPWTEAGSEEELQFKALLKDRGVRSLDLLDDDRYEEIVSLWQPLEGNPFFSVDHDEWADKPYFRAQIHSAKCQLFRACVQLGQREDWRVFVPKAFQILNDLLKGPPYSLKGGAPDRLSTDDASTQNLNYKQTLEFALEWFRAWGGSLLQGFGIPARDSAATETLVRQRIGEIDFMLKLRGRPTRTQDSDE